MLIFPILFLILLIWGLKDNQIYWGEAVAWTVAFLIFFGCVLFVPVLRIPGVIATLLLTAGLLFKIVGSDIVVT